MMRSSLITALARKSLKFSILVKKKTFSVVQPSKKISEIDNEHTRNSFSQIFFYLPLTDN